MNEERDKQELDQNAEETIDDKSVESEAIAEEIKEPSEEDFEAKYNEAQDRYLRAYAEF